MEQLLSRPEIQSAVLPFTVALLLSLGLRKVNAAAWAWAMFVAFAISVLLINGATLTPLTGTRKIMLLVIAALFGAAITGRLAPARKLQPAIVTAISAMALAWIFWAVVARMAPAAIAAFVAGSGALILLLSLSFDRLCTNPARLHAAGFSLLLGVGLSATAAASALLGQLALGLAFASAGVLLAWVLQGSGSAAPTRPAIAVLPYVLAPALIGVAAVMFAQLPWYSLIPLAAIPFAISLVPDKSGSRFLRALLASLPGLAIGIAVALLLWQSSGSDSGY